MDPVKRIASLLDDPSPRKRIAAAVVLGELGVKDAQVVARLTQMAKDPIDAYAEAGLEALGALKALKALPVLLEALGRGREVQARAKEAIAHLGEAALPELKERLATATPEVRAILSQLLPAVGGKASMEMTLEGTLGQSFEDINKVALSVRHEAKQSSEAGRKVMKTQLQKFLAKKKVEADEPALRGALKMLGFLELPEAQDTLLPYMSKKHPPLVRVEAVTALRFALSKAPTKKGLRTLLALLDDSEVLVTRAARDSLTVLKIGPEFADELALLCGAGDGQVALWAIGHLGALGANSSLAAKTLLPVARGADRIRAQAAAKVLAELPQGQSLLVEALADAEEEVGANVLAEAVAPLAVHLSAKDVKRLLAAGEKNLSKSLAVARRQLEPVRAANPRAWAEVLREKAKALRKKDEARAEAIAQLLGQSSVATDEDRFGVAVQQLLHSSLDAHPMARQRDPALVTLERLHQEGFKVPEAVNKDKRLSDDIRYYVGVHFAEKSTYELKSLGAEVLEVLAGKGKTKLARAAKNKMKLLAL